MIPHGVAATQKRVVAGSNRYPAILPYEGGNVNDDSL